MAQAGHYTRQDFDFAKHRSQNECLGSDFRFLFFVTSHHFPQKRRSRINHLFLQFFSFADSFDCVTFVQTNNFNADMSKVGINRTVKRAGPSRLIPRNLAANIELKSGVPSKECRQRQIRLTGTN